MIGFFLIVEIANARDKRVVTVRFCPVDGLSLCFERAEYVVGVVFDHIIIVWLPSVLLNSAR
jgi:hypothetical protein